MDREEVPIKKRSEERAEEVKAARDCVTREPVVHGEYLGEHHERGLCVVVCVWVGDVW